MAATSPPGGGEGKPAKVPSCPICGRPRDERLRPFCSARCRDSDLLRWFKGDYAIPATEVEPDDDSTGIDPDER